MITSFFGPSVLGAVLAEAGFFGRIEVGSAASDRRSVRTWHRRFGFFPGSMLLHGYDRLHIGMEGAAIGKVAWLAESVFP